MKHYHIKNAHGSMCHLLSLLAFSCCFIFVSCYLPELQVIKYKGVFYYHWQKYTGNENEMTENEPLILDNKIKVEILHGRYSTTSEDYLALDQQNKNDTTVNPDLAYSAIYLTFLKAQEVMTYNFDSLDIGCYNPSIHFQDRSTWNLFDSKKGDPILPFIGKKQSNENATWKTDRNVMLVIETEYGQMLQNNDSLYIAPCDFLLDANGKRLIEDTIKIYIHHFHFTPEDIKRQEKRALKQKMRKEKKALKAQKKAEKEAK